ncbi:MAG: hypothetical protein L0216_08930 [Planctomycetales bacterium]|nr:hypothetical protein [Planctomycetales bacterium]
MSVRTPALLLLAALGAPARAQEPAPAVPWAAAQKKEGEAAVRAWFSAGDDAGRAAALARAEALPPLSRADVAWAMRLVLAGLATGTRYPGKGTGSIRLPDFPGLEGKYTVIGTKGKARQPLLIGLHGGGEGVGDGAQIAAFFGGSGMLSIYPTVMQKDDSAWNKEREERYVLALLEEAKRSFDVDTNRVYLAGHSMGGYGTWSIGCRHADRFAALAEGAGGLFGRGKRADGTVEVEEHLLPNLFRTPIWFFHSTDDPQVGPGPDQEAARILADLRTKTGGYEHVWKEYTNIGHGMPKDGWTPIWKWMEGKTRDPAPKKVIWEPTRPYKRQLFWLYWAEPRKGAHVEAEVTAPNRIEVKGAAPGLSVLLRQGLVDLRKPVTVLADGQEVHSGPVPETLGAILSSAGESRDRELLFTARVSVGRG